MDLNFFYFTSSWNTYTVPIFFRHWGQSRVPLLVDITSNFCEYQELDLWDVNKVLQLTKRSALNPFRSQFQQDLADVQSRTLKFYLWKESKCIENNCFKKSLLSYMLCQKLYKRNEWSKNHHCACTNILTCNKFVGVHSYRYVI